MGIFNRSKGMIWCWVLPAGGCLKLSSDKREVFFLFIAIYCLISTQTYCNQRFKSAGHKFLKFFLICVKIKPLFIFPPYCHTQWVG